VRCDSTAFPPSPAIGHAAQSGAVAPHSIASVFLCALETRRHTRSDCPKTTPNLARLILEQSRFITYMNASILTACALVGITMAIGVPSLMADDRKDIVGNWKGEMPGDPAGSIELVITPERISGRYLKTGKSLGEGTYQLDPAKKTIDAQGIENPVRGNRYVGLYSIEGNTLKWVSNSRGRKRPVDLVHRPDRDQFLMILKRQR
jgi:hypothetical protein